MSGADLRSDSTSIRRDGGSDSTSIRRDGGSDSASIRRHWPLFDLVVRTPRLELRYVDDELAGLLVDLAARGVHDPATMPFRIPWTDAEPPELQRASLRYYWGNRARLSPDDWVLDLAVLVDGEVVGAAGLQGERFPTLRSVETGSWLGRSHQGQGLGTEVRRANLHLAFAGLGAAVAESGAMADNPASRAVSRKLGYAENGRRPILQRDRPGELVWFRLDREAWAAHLPGRGADITIDGLDGVSELLGC